MKKIWKEPLLHFLLIGGGIFLCYELLNINEENPEEYTIIIDDTDIARLQQAYQKNWGKAPDSTTTQALIDEEIRAEIFYREALRMQLDHNDEIIRRRLRQKYEFLIKDLKAQDLPDSTQLQAFYQEHIDRYQSPKKISFQQLYFSPDNRENPAEDAAKIFNQIKENKPETSTVKTLGDPFYLQFFYSEREEESIRQLFGKAFADQLFSINETGWHGPISSGYGYHLVNISYISAASPTPFKTIEKDILADWKQQHLEDYNEQLFQSLKQQYQVEIIHNSSE
jgi:hypothetical protein